MRAFRDKARERVQACKLALEKVKKELADAAATPQDEPASASM
jgi:predicted DNA-binding WGR domain protein